MSNKIGNEVSWADVRGLFAEVALSFQETDRRFKETALQFKETDRQFKETDLKFKETDRQFKETDRKLQESDRKSQEAFQEMRLSIKNMRQEVQAEWNETSRKIREVSQQIGGLGNKFGSFTEGLALPSMQKILSQRFGVDTVSPSVRVSRNGKHLEVDVLAYANGTVNSVYVVEVKSHLREESITQLLRILENFAEWFPEHKNKKLFGILAAVDIPESLRQRVLDQGLYLARIHGDLFELQVPEQFEPRQFSCQPLQ